MRKLLNLSVEPVKPVEPKLGRKPSILRKVDLEAKRNGYGTEKDSYRWERCSGCNAIIGKDYGSFSHTCEGGEARQKYLAPLYQYESDLKDYESAVFLKSVYERLMSVGMEEEEARSIVQHAYEKYDVENALWPITYLLDRIEK